MRVAVSIRVAAAVDALRVMQQGVAIEIPGAFQFLQEFRELAGIPEIDLRNFLHPFIAILMV